MIVVEGRDGSKGDAPAMLVSKIKEFKNDKKRILYVGGTFYNAQVLSHYTVKLLSKNLKETSIQKVIKEFDLDKIDVIVINLKIDSSIIAQLKELETEIGKEILVRISDENMENTTIKEI